MASNIRTTYRFNFKSFVQSDMALLSIIKSYHNNKKRKADKIQNKIESLKKAQHNKTENVTGSI